MKKNIEQNLDKYCQQINRECFWDYTISNSEILKIAKNGNDQEKFFLFSKIIENATDIFKSLSIFSVSDQKIMSHRYNPPTFNRNFLDKRRKIIKYFLTGEKVDIPELRWNI